MYDAGILDKIVKEFWQNTFVPCIYKFAVACRRYTLTTVNISKILSKGTALSVFSSDRVAKNINLITCMILLSSYFMGSVLHLIPFTDSSVRFFIDDSSRGTCVHFHARVNSV